MTNGTRVAMASTSSGMAHLIEAANPHPQHQAKPPEFPSDKCLKLRCILEGVDYYIPEGNGGIVQEPPYFPFYAPLAYSVVKLDPENPKSDFVIKHAEKRFYQT